MKVLKETLIILLAAMVISLMLPVFNAGNVFAASKVRLNKTSLLMSAGDTYKLKLSGTSKKVTWHTKSKSVVTVSSHGRLKAKKAGYTTVYAKAGTKKYNCKVYIGKTIIDNSYVTIAYLNTGMEYLSKAKVHYGTSYFAVKNKYKSNIECTPTCIAFDGLSMQLDDLNDVNVKPGNVGLMYMGVYDLKSSRHQKMSTMFAFVTDDYSSMQRLTATDTVIGTNAVTEFTEPEGSAILDNDSFKLTYVRYDKNDGAIFYLTNKTDKYVNFNFGDTKVNGVKYADSGQDYDVYFAPGTSGYYSYACSVTDKKLESLKGSVIFNDNVYAIEKALCQMLGWSTIE